MNTVIMLLLLNLGLGIYYAVAGDHSGETEALDSPLTAYSPEILAQFYPNLTEEERTNLLTETFTRSLICAPYVHYRERPYSGEYVNVSEAGFRSNGGEQPWPPPDDAFTVFVFGGSTTFGYGVADHETIPAHLETALTAALPDQSPLVYNFGQGGYFSSQELKLFENLLYAGHRPDVVVFIDGHNDSWFNSYFGGGGPYSGPYVQCGDKPETTTQSSGFQIPLLRLANDIREKAREEAGENTTAYDQHLQEVNRLYTEEPDEYQSLRTSEAIRVVAEWETNRTIIRSIAEAYGIQPVFVWQPNVFYQYTGQILPPGGILSEVVEAAYIHMADRRAEWERWDDFLYLADIQAGRDELLYVDAVHYNPDFSQEIAGLIADFIIETGD